MRYYLLIFALLLASPCLAQDAAPNQLTADELADGWISLFDGKTLYGWKPVTKANWHVAEGTITVSSGEKGLLRTTSQFGDFVLKADFRCPATTNSGIFLHTSPQPVGPAIDCYELNIAAKEISDYSTGSLVGRAKAETEADVDTTAWQSFEARVEGGEVTIKLAGEEVCSYTDPDPLGRGFIGLQYNVGKVSFRNLKLKPLGLSSLFNGEDLTGWRSHEESMSEFTVTDEGELNVKDGRGLLETEAEFADFVLQLECISYGMHLNSGIFFRCIPGEFMNGYEAQIQNGYKDGDRSKPIDCGTGGIFRRQDARLVLADDHEWFPMTIVAVGPRKRTFPACSAAMPTTQAPSQTIRSS